MIIKNLIDSDNNIGYTDENIMLHFALIHP